MRARLVLLALCPLLVGFELLRSPNKAVETGNARMKGGKAEEALAEYDKAIKDLPTEPGAHFNRGAALFALSRFEEAANEFLRATEAKTTALKASAFYNLGNSYFRMDKFGDAIAAYRRALSLDPNDIRAKWNLELALKKKKDEDQKKKDDQKKDGDKKDDQQKQDEQDKQDKQDKKDDQQKQDEQDKQDDQSKKQDDKQDPKQDQQAKNQEQQKPEEKKDEQKEQKPEQAKNEEQKQKPEKAADLREIEAVLDSLERSPKDLERERARLRAVRRAAPRKDW